MVENEKWDKMKWTERFPFSVQWLKYNIRCHYYWRLIFLNWRFYITSYWIIVGCFLQPLSHYFIVFENMCHNSSDCGQIEVTNSHKNEFKLKVVWPLLIEKLFMIINCSLLFNDYHRRDVLSWWEALVLRNITRVQNETQ